MLRPGSPYPRVRIGSLLDDTPTCEHPSAAEGIGLYDGYGTASSGHITFRGDLTFAKAAIDVAGQELEEGDLRIYGVSSGRLYVYHAGVWGTICNKSFDNIDAQVVCRIMGFAGGESMWAPGGTGPIWMDGVQCSGHETSILQCNHYGWGSVHGCDHGMDAGIQCLEEDQHFEFVGCYSTENMIAQDLPFGPQTSGYNTALCGVACQLFTFMSLRDNGFCSCGDTVTLTNITSADECGSVCAGEIEMGPIRYCGGVLRSAVYRLYDDKNVTISEPIVNASIPLNLTIENIIEVIPEPEISLQYTEPQRFRKAVSGVGGGTSLDTWLLEPHASKLDPGRRYKLCTDLDGEGDHLVVGDTGLSVFLSPITEVIPESIQQSDSNSSDFFLSCGLDGCGVLPDPLSYAYLASSCSMAPKSRNSQVCFANYSLYSADDLDPSTPLAEIQVLFNGVATFSLDTSCLSPGHQYRVCLLLGRDDVGVDSGFSVTFLHTPLVAVS